MSCRYPLAIFLFCLLALMIALPQPALPAGTIHYVSTGGNDQGAGSLEAPWRTIQHAVDASSAGDTVLVRDGTYGEAVIIDAGGLSEEPLTLSAFPGENPVLDGGGEQWAGFQLVSGADWVNIEGFKIQDFRVGIDVNGGNSHVSLSDIEVSNSEVGMRMTWGYSGDEPMFGPVDHVSIDASSFHDNHFSGIDCTPGPCDDLAFSGVDILDNGVGAESFGADGLAVEKGARIDITNLRSINNGGDGIDLNSRDGGPVEGIVVSGSTVANNHRNGMKLWAGGRIENSLIYGTGFNPLVLAAFSNVDVELVNNTVAMNMWDPSFAVRDYAMTVGYPEGEEPQTGVSLTMINNIFAFNTGPEVGSPTGIYLGPGVVLAAENNNLFHSRDDGEIVAAFTARGYYSRDEIADGTWAADTGRGGADLVDDPLFVDAANADFHLAPGSQALDAASPVGAPTTDIAGWQRPRGSGFDIGAYEGGGVAQPVLGWACARSYWSSYADYVARTLSVEYSLSNTGPGAALTLAITDSVSGSGVEVLTSLPLGLGDLSGGHNQQVTLRYLIPSGVASFTTLTRLSGTDLDGGEVRYP